MLQIRGLSLPSPPKSWCLIKHLHTPLNKAFENQVDLGGKVERRVHDNPMMFLVWILEWIQFHPLREKTQENKLVWGGRGEG